MAIEIRNNTSDLPVYSILSDEQIDIFHRTGFLIIPNLFNREEMINMSRWTDELAALPETPGKQMMYFEQSLVDSHKRILSRIENFCPYHSDFKELISESMLQGCVSRLFGEESVLFKDKINFKMPGADGFKPHQDVQAGWDKYSGLHITALVSIDACTPENGCLEIAGGCHRQGLIGSMWQPLNDADMSSMHFEFCETRPGDVIFFDSFAPHCSAPNRTNLPRRVLYITYNRNSEGDQRSKYYADKRKSYPPDCERESNRDYTFRV